VWPFGKSFRRRLFDPAYFDDASVTWRNYEASRDTAELEPASREASTYVLRSTNKFRNKLLDKYLRPSEH
jgi:hypothetical protein